MNIGKARVNKEFKNWNNPIGNNFKPMHGKIFRRVVYQTVAQTFQQDQILRDIIENKEHLKTEDIVAIDVEYGGGKTVPRVGIVNFNEESVYYSDFCLRYNDWDETKRLLREERVKGEKAAQRALDRNKGDTNKNLEKIAKEEYYAQKGSIQNNQSTKASTKQSQSLKRQREESDTDEDVDDIENEFDQEFNSEIQEAQHKSADFHIDTEGKKIFNDETKHKQSLEDSNLTMNELFSKSKQTRFKSKLDDGNCIIPGMPGGVPKKRDVKASEKQHHEDNNFSPVKGKKAQTEKQKQDQLM